MTGINTAIRGSKDDDSSGGKHGADNQRETEFFILSSDSISAFGSTFSALFARFVVAAVGQNDTLVGMHKCAYDPTSFAYMCEGLKVVTFCLAPGQAVVSL